MSDHEEETEQELLGAAAAYAAEVRRGLEQLQSIVDSPLEDMLAELARRDEQRRGRQSLELPEDSTVSCTVAGQQVVIHVHADHIRVYGKAGGQLQVLPMDQDEVRIRPTGQRETY